MSIDRVLDAFVVSKGGGAVVLQGRWGVGKTHFWRYRIAARLLAKPWTVRYSYVSLFGVNSLAELKTALAVATQEFDAGARRSWWASRWLIGRLWRSARQLPDGVALIPRHGAQLARLVEKLGFHLVRDRVICFDDIERRGGGLAMRDVLGLVAFLAEQRGCRVVVILNANQLGSDTATWDEYREKVFQGELTFAPSMEETIELGLMDHAGRSWAPALRGFLMQLRISNIRLVHRAARFMALAEEVIGYEPVRASTLEHMAQLVALFVYSLHGRGDGGPPIERVLRRQSFLASAMFDGSKQDVRTPQAKAWDTVIHEYGVHPHTPLDDALHAMVEAGYPDADVLRAAVRMFENNAAMYEQKEAWHQAWRTYHDTVADNGPAIVAAFERTWPVVSHVEHALNLQGMARLLRLLGRADLASQYIDAWVEHRRVHARESLSTREIHLLGRIDDAELLAAIEAAKRQARPGLALADAFQRMSDPSTYCEDAIAALANAGVDEVTALLDAFEGDTLVRTVRRILELRGHAGELLAVQASVTMEAACQAIAARGGLAADRMKCWFNITPESAAIPNEP